MNIQTGEDLLLEARAESETPEMSLIEFANQEYARAQEELHRSGQLFSMRQVFFCFFFYSGTEYTCHGCRSHEVRRGSIMISPREFDESHPVLVKVETEPARFLEYYICQDCRKVLYCG